MFLCCVLYGIVGNREVYVLPMAEDSDTHDCLCKSKVMYRSNNNLYRIRKSADLGDDTLLSGTFRECNNIRSDNPSAGTRLPNIVLLASCVVGIPSYVFGFIHALDDWKMVAVLIVAGAIFMSGVGYYFYWHGKKEKKESRIRELEIEARLRWLEEIHF